MASQPTVIADEHKQAFSLACVQAFYQEKNMSMNIVYEHLYKILCVLGTLEIFAAKFLCK